MGTRVRMRLAVISALSLVLLIGLAPKAFAAPLVLDNDVGVQWSDSPCFPNNAELPRGAPGLCDFVDGLWRIKPGAELLLVVGAPRLVPDASNAGDLLEIAVDFLSVGLDLFGGPFPGNSTPLFLNVFDTDANPVLRPGEDVPLQLTYLFAPTGLSVPASDVVLKLGSFDGFGLLPQGEDVIFTVAFRPRLGITDGSPSRPDHAAIITFSGPGTVVPEPGTLVLLLAGVTGTGLGARWRRANRMRTD
jgi:PEP-CTERM motif